MRKVELFKDGYRVVTSEEMAPKLRAIGYREKEAEAEKVEENEKPAPAKRGRRANNVDK